MKAGRAIPRAIRDGHGGRGEDGATSVEYGLMVSLIALVIIFAVIAFGGSVRGLFELIVSKAPFN